MQVAVAEVPAEYRSRHGLAVPHIVGLHVVQGPRQQPGERTAVAVHRPPGQCLVQHQFGGLGSVQAGELVHGQTGRLHDVLAQTVLGAPAEAPQAGGPVAGVVAHRGEERHQVGADVPEHGDHGQAQHQHRGEQRGVQGEGAGRRVMAEEDERRVDEEDVPLQRYAHREGRHDVQMEGDHHGQSDRGDGPAVREHQNQRHRVLDDRAAVRGRGGESGRPEIVGVVAVQPSFEPGRAQWAVADHHRHHEREVAVELGGGSAPPQGEHDQFQRGGHVAHREEEDQEGQTVVLRAGGEEDGLVAEPEQCEQHGENGDAPRSQHAGRARGASLGRGAQQPRRRCQQRRVQGHIGHRAPGSRGERNPAGPGGQPYRAGAQPVQQGAHRRQEV